MDDHRSGVTQPLRVTPCWSLDDADIDSLPDSHLPLVNWGYIKPYPPGVLDIALNFSAPVAVQGRPVLEFALGDSARKADFVRGQQVQYIDIEASKQVQEGEFVLQYGEWVTDCIKWDLADALQQSSLKSRLLEIPEVATAGLRNVSGFYFGNGYRFVVSFSNPNPLPLQVPDASHLRAAGCIPFSPQDATVMVPITSIVNFRYIIQQGPRLVLTVKDLNMTRPIQSISVHIPNEDGVETPLLGTPYGMNSLAVSVMSARVPMPETFINFHALPAFLASSLSFGSKWPYAGEVSSLSFTFQLNTNITSGDALNISLPGFLGPGGLSSLVVNGSHAGAFTGTWNTKTSTISLLAVISLQAYTVVNVDVTVANQIRIPRTGVLENDPHVQIAYGGASGEVDAHPLKVTQPVGVAYAGIAYSPPQAGAISDITFTFAVSYPMLPGDTVTFQLPGFQAPRWTDRSLAISDLQAWNIPASQWSPAEGYNISTLYTIGTLAERFYADWYAVNSSVVFTATRVIPALLEAKITVLRRNKISLPPYGMNINDTRLGVSIRTQVYGNTSFRPVPKSVPVGVFQWAHSSLSKPFAGAVSAMNISFILNTDLDIGENVRVSYPKFYGCPNASLSLSGADASSFDATWEQDKSENGDWGSVVLIARNRFGNGTLVQLVVNEENYLHVADDGLPHCPYISTTASHGPVVRQEMNCTAIGHFIYSQVVIDQGSTLLNATLGLRFRFNQMITFGSGIDLRFQGLRVNLTSALQQQTVYLTGPHGRDFNAYVFASSTADVTIRLTAKNVFPEEELVNVTMGFRSGARLPLRGVMEGDPAIRIWCNSTLAPMLVEEPVMISTPVGIFFSSLAYAPRQAGAPTALTFSFTATGRILAGERLLLSLPGFSGPDTGGHYVVAEGKDGDKFHAYWNQSTSVLVLIAQRLIMPQRQSLIVPIQLGISLPSNGTRRNDVGITVTLTTMSMGLLENVPILFSDGVGAILASAFDVLTPVSGKVTQMDVAFILSGRLHTYDYVYLSLPDFSAAVDIPNVSLSGAHAGNFSGYWNEKTSTLTLKSNADMPAGPISTTIDASNMIRVPMTGYLPSHAITLATDSSETPVVPTNIKKISPVGHFMRSTVSFAPSQEKAPVMTMEALWIIFGFHLNCALKVGDTVTYTMPDLTGPALRYNLTLYGSSAGLFYGIWNASSQTVAFQATQRLMPGPYRMVVAPEGGLALPSSGYYRNDPKVMISTNASDGPVLPLPVISTQPVGFVASELRISPRRPGGPVRLEVDTMLTVDLMPSESLLLYFPSFSARDSNAIQLLGRFNLSFQASWSNVTSILNVTVTRNVIPSYTPISLGISSSNGITPPSIGVPAGDTMRLGTNARSIIPGNRTLWTNYQSVSVFGTLSPLGILFSPSVAGDTCSISLNFTLSCDLVAGDALFYHIPEMEYDPAGTEAVTLMIVDVEGYTAPHIPFTLTFDPGESVLVLTAVSTVIQGKVHVRIGAENGLRLPVHGIESNDPRLQAWSNASGCPVIAQTFDSVQAVGAFIESGILYSPQLQADVNITAYFNITSNLAVADTVTFTLPGFTGPSGVMLACEGSLASRFQVSWNTTTEKLVFIALQDIKAYTLVNLTVTSANQLQLPSTGLRLADPSLRVAFSARDAYVDDAQVINSPGIGILRSSVDLLPLVAGQPSEITLRAQLSHPLAVGDTLLFQLPGFSGPTSSNNLTMMGHAAYRSFKPSFNGSWDDASKLLTLTAIHVIDLQEVVAIVAAENKLSLPASGLMPTATLLVSSTSKEFGDHAAIPITEFPSFGELGNRVAGALTQMSLNLSYTGNLSIGDQIVIRFPGFRRSSTRPITLSGPGIQHFNYSWLTADKGIVSENFDWVESLNLEKGWIRRSSTNCILDAKTTIPRPSLLLPTMGPFVVVDGSESPFVIDIFSTTGSGPHGPGEIIDIHVRFSHPVVILGAEPTLNLDVGGPLPVSAEYLEGNETDALVFVYIIQQGHASNDLSCYDRRSLNSSGGLIVSDSAPFVVAANLTLPAYCGSLSRIKGVPTPMVVDGLTPPKVTLVTTKKATGTYGAGEVIDLLVYFSRPVVVSGSPYIIMNSGVSTNSTAVYTTGGSIQRIDIGVKEGHWLQNGGFLLQYKDQSTNCLSWNESYSIGQAVYDGLQSIPEIQVAGLAAVTVSEVGKGYRLTLNFSYDFVEALHPSASFCGGNGEDLVVAPSTEIVFRYIVQQGDMAINLDVAGTTSLKIDTGRGDSILLDSDRPMLAADLKLPIPGQANSLSGSCNISIDTTPPYVMSVSALDPSGSYSSANNLTFSVRFSLPVVVSGISLIALNLVPLGRHASYVSGSGSTALIFRYTIKFPDVSNALDYTGPDSLSLNGGSILRLSTIPFTPANLTMPWGNLSLAHRYNVSVDYKQAARVIQVASTLPDGVYGVGQEVPIIVTFSSAVTLYRGEAILLLDTGNPVFNRTTSSNASVAHFVDGSGTPHWTFLYTVKEGDNTTAVNFLGARALRLANTNTSAIDANDNHANLAMYPGAKDVRALNYSSRIALHDEQPRVLTVTTTLPNGTYGIGQVIDFEVTFTLPVSVVGQPRLQIQTFYLRPDAQAKYISGSGTLTLTFLYVTADEDWGKGLPAAESQLVDYDGVSALYALTSPNGSRILRHSTHPTTPALLWLPQQDKSTLAPYQIRVDPSPPRVIQVDLQVADGTYGVGEDIMVTVIFTYPVTVYGTPTMLMDTGPDHASRAYATYHSGNNTRFINYIYRIREGDTSEALDYVDTRFAPYNVDVAASAALAVSDYWLSARQLFPIPGQPRTMIKRTSTFPTTDADLTLPLPGEYGSLSYQRQVKVDSSPPIVLQVTTDVPDGTYGSGYVIDLFVIFSAPVIVTGTPWLWLEAGVDDRLVPYVAGNGTAKLTFRYVVQAGDKTSRLDYKSSASLLLAVDTMWKTDGAPRSTIKRLSDHPTTNADITLPPPGKPITVNSPKSLVGSGHSIAIQTANLFVVNVISGVPDGRYGVGHEIPLNITFSENVTVVGFPRLRLNVSVGFYAEYVGGSGSRILNFLYRVRKGDNTPRLGYPTRDSIILNGAVISSLEAGVDAVVTLPPPGANGSLDHDYAIEIDTTSVWVTQVRALNASGQYGAGDQLLFVVNFSSPVSLLEGAPELLLRLDKGIIARSKCFQPALGVYSGMLFCGYLVEDDQSTVLLDYYDEKSLILDHSVTLRASSVPLASVQPRLPCPGSLTSISGSVQIGIDPLPTVLTSVTSLTRDGTYGAGDRIDLLLHFSRSVEVFGKPLLYMNSAPSSAAVYVNGNGTSVLQFSMLLGPEDSTSDLDYRDTRSLVADIKVGAAIQRCCSTGSSQKVLLCLPPQGMVGNLAYGADLVVDNTVPRVTRIWTPLANGTYGPETEVPLVVEFSGDVSVCQSPQGLWPLIRMRIGDAHGVGAAIFQRQDSKRLHFIFVMKDTFPSGPVEVDGADAFICPMKACVVAVTGERANTQLPGVGLVCGEMGSSRSSIYYDGNNPLVSEVFFAGDAPKYGVAVGDVVTIGVRFSAPVRVNVTDHDRPRLALNVRSDGSALASYNHSYGLYELYFTYQVQPGDCSVALDYINIQALQGEIRRAAETNTSVVRMTLTAPGTRGSISYSKKVAVVCDAPYVEGIFPLKIPQGPEVYVEGEPVFLVVRFSQPVIVRGQPTLALFTGRNETGVAHYYPYKLIADNMMFRALPTDVIFLYKVHKDDMAKRLRHAGRHAIGLDNAAIMRAAMVPTTPADVECADPGWDDSTLGHTKGRWLADYPKKVEIFMRDLWHPEASDLRVTLTHGNATVKLLTNSLARKSFGAPYKREFTPASMARANSTMSVSQQEGIGWDYLVADSVLPNLALSAIANQSSTLFGASAERGNDGNIDGRFSFGSVVHTGVVEGGEPEPWWQLRFQNDVQEIGTIHLWRRVRESDVDEIQTVTVEAPEAPIGSFALSFTTDSNVTITTLPIFADASAVFMQSRLDELGALGRVQVTRTSSRMLVGHTWSITFVTFPAQVPRLRITQMNSTTPGIQYNTQVLRPGRARDQYGSISGSRQQFQSRLFPCYAMVFNASTVPQSLSTLDEAIKASIWSKRLTKDQQLTAVGLPPGVRGKYLRIQLEGTGYLSFAEVQVYAKSMMTMSEYEGGSRVIPRFITQPFQPEEPLMDTLKLLPAQGAWNLQIVDSFTQESIRGPDGRLRQQNGRGQIGDWVLILTDHADLVRLFYMDITGMLVDLPKYGNLYGETVTAMEGWEQFFGSPNEGPVPVGLSDRVVGSCLGIDRTGPYRHCYQNFGVGPSLSPPRSSDRALFSFLDRERIVYYRPGPNFLGIDTFTYRMMTGVSPSLMEGKITVHIRNCRGKAVPPAYDDKARALCACVRTDSSFFGAPECSEAVVAVCENADLATVFDNMCTTCYFAHWSSDCLGEVHRASLLLKERGMCTQTGSTANTYQPDCQTERFDNPPREAYITQDSPVANQDIVPLENANMGKGFMWSPLWR